MKNLLIVVFAALQFSVSAQCFPDRHSTNWNDSWISCNLKENPNPAHPASHWILFDLNRNFRIDQFKIWNLNDPGRLDWGMLKIAIDYSIDSIVWNHAGEFQLQPAEGNNRYEGMPWTDIIIPKARYVLITDVDDQPKDCAGLSEILFSAEKVQNPVSTEPEIVSEGFTVTARPNPFSEILFIEFESSTKKDIHYQLVDVYGKIIESGTVQTQQGYNFVKWASRKWLPGAYYLMTSDGFRQQRTLLFKI